MSRHRAIRNINLDDELDDDALDDNGPYPGITPEQREQMTASLAAVKSVLGDTFPDKDICDSLWYYYFDTEKTIAWLLDQQSKKAAKQAKQAAKSAPATPQKKKKVPTAAPSTQSRPSTPQPNALSRVQADLEGMGLASSAGPSASGTSTPQTTASDEYEYPKVETVAKEKILEKLRTGEGKPVISMVVVGHVDSGKSTLMGKMLAELGELSEKAATQNQRQSEKIGKGSFAHAWALDALPEERNRGVTIELGIDSFSTPSRRFTLIDAPGHRDFVPNMISGAAQADVALLVADAGPGGFEKGFLAGGQTREHTRLVRSLGTKQLVVAVNKLDMTEWSQTRFEEIKSHLDPYLQSVGFAQENIVYIPCSAIQGENVISRKAQKLKAWYRGHTLYEALDVLDIPQRPYDAPLRVPIFNVFKSMGAGPSGLGISGRIESGIVQVGEKVAILPGDATGVVRSIEMDGDYVGYASAGSNCSIFLSGIDQLYVSPGNVLCSASNPISTADTFLAQVVVFDDLTYPLIAGCSVELFHHSRDVPATFSKLEATIDKSSGTIIKRNPRMLTSGTSARVIVKIKKSAGTIPLEPFTVNKSMGRVLFRRDGETVAAGMVLELLPSDA